jgi:hypothetical protein
MSTEQDKIKHSTRLQKDENAIKKQVKIAKQNGLTDQDKSIKEPNRLSKHHAMDCGNPGCMMCGNPRKTFNELTTQEKRLFQDLDQLHTKHSNGLPSSDTE